MTALHRQVYSVNGITLNVWEAGPRDGPALMLLHGFPEAGFAWHHHSLYFAAEGYRVLAPDQRGYNLSSRPKEVEAYSMEVLVQDIVALIAAAGLHTVTLAGHDWGGSVAWHLAMHYPQLVCRLIILNMPHPAVMRKTLLHSNRQKIKSSYAAFFRLPLLPEWLAGAFHFRALEHSLTRTSVRGTFGPEILAAYRKAWSQPGALTGMINWYRAYHFGEQKPATLHMPVLIIWGKKDVFLLPQMAQESAGCCADARLVVLEDATHWLHHEQPERIGYLIHGFLREGP